jgi:hypothetical protein
MTRFSTALLLGLVAASLIRAQGPPVAPGGPPAEQLPYTPSVARLANADDLRRQLGLLPAYADVTGFEDVKVAVLDYGFEGVDASRPYLPADTVVVENYDPEFIRRFNLGNPEFTKPFAPGNTHGRVMAQIVWGMTGNNPRGPKFFLLNANGPTMLRRAVRYAIEKHVDVILFSASFEGAGNYDGKGPINAAVDDALAAGIIWVNAAGNYGGRVYNGPIQTNPGGFLRLGRDGSLRFRNLFDENTVSITLTWNDYRDQEDAGTDKDLDLYVTDQQGHVLGSSSLTQVSGAHQAGPGETRNPRERIVLPDLPAAPDRDYLIYVKARSRNFTPSDQLRILLSATRDVPFRDPKTGVLTQPLQFLDASESGEIFPPADHPRVLTVGDSTRFSALGPTIDRRVKPDVVVLDSTVRLSNGDETMGASNAAACFAGVVAVLKAAQPALRTSHLLALARRMDTPTERPNPGAGSTPPRRPQLDGSGRPIRPRPPTDSHARALRYAEELQRDHRSRGLPPGGVWITLRDGRQVPLGWPPTAETQPEVSDRSAPATRPVQPSRPSGTPSATPLLKRPPPPRGPWRTPSPKFLAEFIRLSP